MNRTFRNMLLLAALAAIAFPARAQEEPLPFGDMNRWRVREVKESFVIGGKSRLLYELAAGDTLRDNTPFVPNLAVSPWATSSVLARVSGVTKASVTVFPEKRGDGYAARLETRVEQVKVLGVVNISVLAAGTLFLGEVVEPVRDTKNPQSKLMMGIPFTRRPESVVFDYKFRQGDDNGKRLKITGFSRKGEVPGTNHAEMCLLLQKRWEDADGNVFAERVGTAWQQYSQTTPEWVNGNEVTVLYGDITGHPSFKSFMGLITSEENLPYCRNSKGEVVPIRETGWAGPGETPTHIVLRFSSSHGGAYIGAPGSVFYVDNVKLKY